MIVPGTYRVSECQVNACFEPSETSFFHQVDSEPAKAKPALIISEARQELTEPNVSKRGGVTVATLQADVGHSTGDKPGQVFIGKPGRRLERREHLQRG